MSLAETAQRIVSIARDMGATGSEASLSAGDEFGVTVRLGEVEKLKESGSRGAGVRVLFGRHTGSSYTSDLTEEGLRTMVRQACELAKITTEDPTAGLPDPADLGSISTDLALYNDDVAALDTPTRIDWARRAERTALDFDKRITNSEGGSFGAHTGEHAFANSHGFSGAYRTSSCSLSMVAVAQDGDRMERDHWYSAARSVSKLEPPEQVGRIAAERTLRRLNPRKVPTQKAAVVFDPRVARSMVGHVFEAINGDSVYRKASFLHDKLGEKIASDLVTVIDDATMPGLFGSSPFDDEGVPSRRTVVVENGVLKSYLLNTYTARKLGMKTTGNASRGLTGNAGVGHGNLYLRNGEKSVEQLLRQAGTGLYVTELMGFGVDVASGDYSRGASGLWIENGELAYPVSEVTIAGNLKHMFLNIEATADDLEFRTSVAAPTLLIREMTISGR
ncbi:MAG: metallopeptidase TldD-related protein [Bryobacteraceae bacterium]